MQAIVFNSMINFLLLCCIVYLYKRYQQSKNSGYVYVISNVIYGKHIYKIGMTRRKNPYVRIKELNNAALTHDFDVHIMFKCINSYVTEQKLHSVLSQYHYSKEFFCCDKKTILSAFKKVTSKTPQWHN